MLVEWWITERRLNALGRWVVTACDMSGRRVRVTISSRSRGEPDERAIIAATFSGLYVPHTIRRIRCR